MPLPVEVKLEHNSLPTLFKKSNNGKIVQWIVYFGEGAYWTQSGYVGMKLSTTAAISAQAKNVGKSNEITQELQAHLDASSLWKRKKDEGYYLTLEEAETSTEPVPMLDVDEIQCP